MALSTGKKALIAVLTVVLGGAALAGVYFLVPTVKEKVNDTVENLINKIKDKTNGDSNTNDKKDEQQKTEEKKDQIQNDERLENFDDDKKGEIVDKFEKITDSDDYKNMSDKEKDELVDKLIESEVIQEQIKVEQIEQETRQEEVKQELGSLSTELSDILNNDEQTQTEQVAQVSEAINNIKQELQETINSDSSSPEEIAAAQEKLDQVEAVEQEYAYHVTTDVVKNVVSESPSMATRRSKMSIVKINGIYAKNGLAYFNADFLKEQVVGGITIYSEVNCFFTISEILTGSETYQEIIEVISRSEDIALKNECTNFDLESHKNFFETNDEIKKCLTYVSDCEIIQSWERVGDNSHPEYIIQGKKIYKKVTYLMSYYERTDEYLLDEIEKICPEFWAQKEIEESKQSAEAQASADEKYIKRDKGGNVTGFDYVAFQQDQANKAQETKTSQDTYTSLYANLDLGRSL